MRIAKSPVAPNNTKSKFVCVLIVLSRQERIFRCRLKPVFPITLHRNIGNKGRRHNE
ncbi:hypothetical protein F528_1627 [Neisseria meningitidis 992008]|nr:hypothetical protein F528_1627 [Neisseria meningitidis 992008]